MVWARLDDQFHAHDKVADLDMAPTTVPMMVAAVGLHALALSWCGDQLTDGIVPRSQPARLVGEPVDNLVEELVRVHLWDKHRRGYVIHDFLDYNPSKAQILARRQAQSEAGKRGAEARWHSGNDGTPHGDPLTDPIGNPIGNPIGSRWHPDGKPHGTLHAPDPVSQEDKYEGVNKRAREEDAFKDIDFGEEGKEDPEPPPCPKPSWSDVEGGPRYENIVVPDGAW